MKKLIPILVALLVLCAIVAPAMAQTPFRLSRVGATVLTYDNDIVTPASALFVPKIVYVTGVETGSTAVVKHIAGTITNTLASKELTATDRMVVISNTYWVWKGDKLAVTGIATNSTWYLVGEEQ